MKQLKSYRRMPPGVPSMLIRGLGLIQSKVLQLGTIDRRYEGELVEGGRCVWTTDGRRVEFESLPGGGWQAARSADPDPLYATLEGDVEFESLPGGGWRAARSADPDPL